MCMYKTQQAAAQSGSLMWTLCNSVVIKWGCGCTACTDVDTPYFQISTWFKSGLKVWLYLLTFYDHMFKTNLLWDQLIVLLESQVLMYVTTPFFVGTTQTLFGGVTEWCLLPVFLNNLWFTQQSWRGTYPTLASFFLDCHDINVNDRWSVCHFNWQPADLCY